MSYNEESHTATDAQDVNFASDHEQRRVYQTWSSAISGDGYWRGALCPTSVLSANISAPDSVTSLSQCFSFLSRTFTGGLVESKRISKSPPLKS